MRKQSAFQTWGFITFGSSWTEYVQPFLCAWSSDRNTSFPEAVRPSGPSPSWGPRAWGAAELWVRPGSRRESTVPFLSVGKQMLHWGWGRTELKEHVSFWMHDLGRTALMQWGTTPVSIFLLHELTICSWLIIIFIILANIHLYPSPTIEKDVFISWFILYIVFSISLVIPALLVPQPLPQAPKMPLL